ncbi:bifunctional hydroxymethylpyrimidine kinase/phosphomethylpyrimidine kinase [Thalassospira sp. TSL5-1]|uniref:bifunctional hydroxymethylpyrimidine kinase/phosphomethylpyrimidine kinase n=1 Tax=Thalassospira sp. TSL5-1 TaxID=1544451 RepID=UPI00093CF7E8|nr:bifunctional hydroxymethylpyrimidine kinase/phosphomethylpyrimidine kinase [Thalassospira sp. TSL5-1]OKH89511.1 phosphomethylpyrimidine kinase [Thalassospira sp. TSL5-1]
MKGRVLIMAGSDSSGGAGIQADIKTVTVLGGYAATAITALTAQNTQGVFGVLGIDPAFITQQAELMIDDIGVDCLKTGMLHSVPVIRAVVDILDGKAAGVPVVIDPVMISQSGSRLLEEDAVESVIKLLVPRATVLTPNIPEAEVLTGMRITSEDDMIAAAEKIGAMGAKAVLLKGGHSQGDKIVDILWDREHGVSGFEDTRIPSDNNHGTGCTLASAIATGIAQGLNLEDAVARARDYVRKAIRTAPDFGKGNGPLNHAHPVTGE